MREPWLPLLLMEGFLLAVDFLCVAWFYLAMLVMYDQSATSVESEQGPYYEPCPRKVKQEEVREYVVELMRLKDADRMSNVVTYGLACQSRCCYLYGEKVVHIPYGNKMLIVESNKGVSRLKVISCIKAHKYVERGCHLFLAHVTENKSKEKRLEDVPIIRDFPEVFHEELPGLPPPRQVEFRIDLVPVAAPVARASYRLAPSKMRELSVQLQELLEKGFIHPSSSP
ncbi:hypothetical protein Tco_0702402 [Tanacetum coccineum]|uniref:Reverse transcriptase domain-containing protein n=1 Tax=Tanacetum coccineum TaxID=301880 RepID=A0ABQ4XWQ5_9ASTR